MSGVALLVADARFDLKQGVTSARSVMDGGEIIAVVVGRDDAGTAAAGAAGADRILVLDGPGLAPLLPEAAAAVLAEACDRHRVELLVLPAAAPWREAVGPIAARSDGACATDVLELGRGEDGGLLADRLLYGGTVVATVALQRRFAVVTMALPAPDPGVSGGGTPAVTLEEVTVPPLGKELLAREPIERETNLSAAKRIVSVGRGLRSQDDLAMMEELAAVLEAELGCSRPVTEDLHWLPQERQVGLTGLTVKPELYLAAGISGQIQHQVGMRDSGVIVAINSNPTAPIFDIVDIGIVGDIYDIVPRLTAALAARRAKQT